MMRNVKAVPYFKVLFQYLPGWTDGKHVRIAGFRIKIRSRDLMNMKQECYALDDMFVYITK